MTTPRVSVVMAVHNGERYLEAAVESILSQTFRDFEFLIVDDASTDGTAAMLERFAAADPRIRVLRNDRNLGPYPSANRALEIARAPIIARMDADDISLPHRLERQVAFLDAHPDHLLVGSGYRSIDAQGQQLGAKSQPLDDLAARWLLRFRMCFTHPSMCFLRDLPGGQRVRYKDTCAVAQDYDLCAMLSRKGKIAALPDILLHYRTHPGNITSTRHGLQMQRVGEIASCVRAEQFPSALLPGWTDFTRCYLHRQPATVVGLRETLSAFETMIAWDVKVRPNAETWIRRQAAALIGVAYLQRGGGFRRPWFVIAFLWLARAHVGPLFMRSLEIKGLLPRSWSSDEAIRRHLS